ncbi:MAG: hypothetical protein ABIO72_03065 [Patescibacteria group bacterium]
MGEDFLRRRNDHALRRRDARFAEAMVPDIFYGCSPETVEQIVGSLLGPTECGAELWTPDMFADDTVRFYFGDILVAEIDESDTRRLRERYAAHQGPVIVRVAAIEDEAGMVALDLGALK